MRGPGFLKSSATILQRLITINTIVIVLAIVLICGFIYIKEYYSTINRQISSLSSLGEITSNRLTGVLAFNDFDLAQENVFILKRNQNIIAACLYDKNSKLLTSFENHHNDELFCKESTHSITSLMTDEDIVLDGEVLGRLILYSNPKIVRNQMMATLGYLCLVAIICYLLSWLLAKRFFRKETQPIVKLANSARKISATGDYKLRASKGATPTNEISYLVDSFNELLEIVARDNDELEALITQRTTQLKQEKQKVENISDAKSEFIAKLSHDLRTPLTSILGYAEILSAKPDSQKTDSPHLQAIIRNAEFIAKLVSNLLELSKLETTSLKLESAPFDLSKLLQELETAFLPSALNQGVQLIFDCKDLKTRWVLGDAVKLQQVLNNLLENAFKFTQQGSVKLVFTPRTIDKENIRGKFVIIDSGTGISEDQLDRIFDDYVQLETSVYSTHGAGLGLAITKKLVEHMGGELTVESELGEGSAFTVNLPLKLAASPTNQQSSLHSAEDMNIKSKLENTCVLVVDDDAGCREILAKTITEIQPSVNIIQARNLADAEENYNQYNPDLIFLDIELPDGNGLELAKKIREYQGNVIIIAASAFNIDNQVLLSEYVDAFVAKPFSKEDIFNSIKDISIKF